MRRTLVLLAIVLAVVLMPAAAQAKAPAAYRGDGTCTVVPATPTVGQNYTITGTNLPPSRTFVLQLFEQNSTQQFPVTTDANGTASVTTSSSYAGFKQAFFREYLRNGQAIDYAKCAFNVT
jgi:hypothetical protein